MAGLKHISALNNRPSVDRNAQSENTTPAASPKDCESVDAIIRALYESISFAPNSQPDFNRLRSLFHSGGRLVPPKGASDASVVVLDVDQFIRNSREYIITAGIEAKGFHEKEIRRATESFGDISHAFSVYESRFTEQDPEPMQRGINSIQLLKDEKRWWVLTVLWDTESAVNPIE